MSYKPETLLSKFPEIKIEKKEPMYDNELTRRTDMAHSSATYTLRTLGKGDNLSKYTARSKAFKETIRCVLGDEWLDLDNLGRVRNKRPGNNI